MPQGSRRLDAPDCRPGYGTEPDAPLHRASIATLADGAQLPSLSARRPVRSGAEWDQPTAWSAGGSAVRPARAKGHRPTRRRQARVPRNAMQEALALEPCARSALCRGGSRSAGRLRPARATVERLAGRRREIREIPYLNEQKGVQGARCQRLVLRVHRIAAYDEPRACTEPADGRAAIRRIGKPTAVEVPPVTEIATACSLHEVPEANRPPESPRPDRALATADVKAAHGHRIAGRALPRRRNAPQPCVHRPQLAIAPRRPPRIVTHVAENRQTLRYDSLAPYRSRTMACVPRRPGRFPAGPVPSERRPISRSLPWSLQR